MPYAYTQALRHAAQLIEEIERGGGPYLAAFFANFAPTTTSYPDWLVRVRTLPDQHDSLEGFACAFSLTFEAGGKR